MKNYSDILISIIIVALLFVVRYSIFEITILFVITYIMVFYVRSIVRSLDRGRMAYLKKYIDGFES